MPTTLFESKRLKVSDDNGWEYVTRKNSTGVVLLVAVTPQNELLMVEQHRPPVQACVLELPAGIAGDNDASESLETAAKRELLEETGYAASNATHLFTGSVSPGLVSEVLSFFHMTGLEKQHEGGGVKEEDEDITVHHVPLAEADAYFARFRAQGGMVDCKAYIGLHVAATHQPK